MDANPRVEVVFQGNTKNLEKAVNTVKEKLTEAQAIGKNFKVNWDGGSGSIKDYEKAFEKANKEWEAYSKSQEKVAQTSSKVSSAEKETKSSVQETGNQVQKTTEDFSGYNSVLYSTTASLQDLSTATKGMLVAVSAAEGAWIKSSLDTYQQYEDALYGMKAAVATVSGSVSEAMAGVREITKSGLISETDAMTAIRNLTSYGYSVQEATEMIKAMTVSAEANRRENLSVSEAVLTASDGIRRESSLMSKSAGNTQTASDAYKEYAQVLGKTASELNDAEKRQAIFNSTLSAGDKYTSSAESYTNSYSASVQNLQNSITNLKSAFGQALAPVVTLANNLISWAIQNKELVVGLGTFIGIIAGAGGLIFVVTKLVGAIASAVAWFGALNVATKGIIVGLATAGTALAVYSLISQQTAQSLDNFSESEDGASESANKLTTSVGGTGGAVRNLQKDIEKLRNEYLDDLKQIEIKHKETIDNLTKQIQEANVDYRRAIDERNAEFAVSQAKEEKKHQEKVDELVTQIEFLRRYNNDYNKQKLANLEFALAKENALYQKQTQAAKEELELQNENDRKAYEEKRSQLQAELDDELAFMNKHRDTLKLVQDRILKDEIEALQARYNEQVKSYEDQKGLAGGAGAGIADSLIDGFNTKVNEADWSGLGKSVGSAFGDNIGEGAKAAVAKFLSDTWKVVKAFADAIAEGFENLFAGNWDYWKGGSSVRNESYWKKKLASGGGGGYATGGFTGRGDVNEIAGVVHKGEYVLPQEMVDQNTGTPKSLGNTIININVSGTFATSAAERRKVADQIVKAINQNNKSRLEASAWQ